MTGAGAKRDGGVAIVLLALLCGVYVAHALYLSGLAEDAFIGFRYAHHLAEGHGLVWNVGEPPVEGYTNFLWVVICAGFVMAGRDVTAWAPVAGMVAGLLTMLYTWRFARRVFGAGVWMTALPCALLAVSGPAAVWATSGMETMLFAWLVTAACYHAAVFGVRRGGSEGLKASVFLVAATLTRPEGLLVAAALAVVGASSRRGRQLLPALAVYLVPVAVYVAWRVGYFGDWLPNTFYVKTAGGPLRLLRGAIYTGAFLLYFGLPLLPLALLAPRRPRHPGTVVCAAVIVSYGAYVLWVGGDYMAMYRFFAPVVALVYLLAARAAAPAFLRRPRLAAAAVAFAVLATAVHSTPLDRALFPKPPRQHGHYGGVQTERWHVARLTLIGRYLATVRTSPGESLATDAIGAVSYYSGLRVYGLHGLVDRGLARAARDGVSGLGLPGHETGDLEYVLSRQPTYVMHSRLFSRHALGYPDDVSPQAADVLRRDYEPVSVLLRDITNAETGYFTYYVRRDQ